MDDFRKDLRSEFERRQAGLGEVRGARETVMKHALTSKDERLGGRLQFATGIAAVLIAALVIATFAYVRAGIGVTRHGGPVISPVVSPTVGTPSIPRGVAILDMDLVDLSNGWVLVTTCVQPMTGTCHYSVAATIDRGRGWSKPVQVGGLFDPTNGDAPRKVVFVDKADGFVYGGAVAFVTHDGGQTWARLDIPAAFVEFITGGGGVAWAATYPCGKGTSCPYEIRSSVDGGRTWSSPHVVPASLPPLQGVSFAAGGLVVATFTDLLITSDGGATWQVSKSACALDNLMQRDVATSDGRELWELCSYFPALQGAVARLLYVSKDAGGSWSQRALPQLGGSTATNRVGDLVSLASGRALFNPGTAGVVISHDDGVTWAKAGPDVRFAYIRFCSASDGWAIDDQNYIWTTTDGGDHWTRTAALQIASS